MRKILSSQTLITSYHWLLENLLTYRILFWGNLTHAFRAFCVQKKAIENIVGASFNESYQPLFSKCTVMPLLCIFIIILLLWRSIKKHLLYPICQPQITMNQKSRLPRIKLQMSTCNQQDLKLYYNIPSDLNELNINIFKSRLKHFHYINIIKILWYFISKYIVNHHHTDPYSQSPN